MNDSYESSLIENWLFRECYSQKVHVTVVFDFSCLSIPGDTECAMNLNNS